MSIRSRQVNRWWRGAWSTPSTAGMPLGATISSIICGVLLSACEHGIDVTGRVVVPVAVQQRFSASRQGRVLVEALVPGMGGSGGSQRWQVGVLCDPASADRELPLRQFEFGCAPGGQATIEAFAVPVPAAQTVACDAPAVPFTFDDAVKGTAVATGMQAPSERVEAGLGSCHDGSVAVDVTLALP